MNKTQIIICGSVAVDRIFSFNEAFADKIDPTKLDIISVSMLMDRYEIVDGGIGPNITFNLSRLGAQPILLGAFGEDGKGYIERLESYGVDTSFVHISSYPTATFVAFTDKDGNQVSGFYPGAMADSDSLSFRPWKGKNVIACISAHDPKSMKRQVAECAEEKIRLLYDPGQQVNNVSGGDLLEGCRAAEIIIVNEYELGILLAKTKLSESDLKNMPQYFITTKGKNGSVVEGRAAPHPITIAIAKPAKVVDPTGAGDAYRGGLLYGLANNWDIEQCARLGAVLSSFNVEVSGHTQNFTIKDVENRFEKTFGERVELN